MIIPEAGIHDNSVRYFFTPSSFAEQTLFFPTRAALYYCDKSYHFTSQSEIGMQPSHHYHYMLFLLESGSMNLILDGRQFRAQKGNAVIFDCKQPHEYNALSDDVIFYWLVFDGITMDSLFDKILELHDDRNVFAASNASELKMLLDRMLSIGAASRHTSEISISELIYSIVCCLLLNQKKSISPNRDLVDEAMYFMDTHYHEPLSVTDIASQVGLSASYLTRCFRQQTGYSPHEYLTIRRISRAKDLLLSSRMTIHQIAFETGYRSEENFIRSFKTATGVSPSVFRRFPV